MKLNSSLSYNTPIYWSPRAEFAATQRTQWKSSSVLIILWIYDIMNISENTIPSINHLHVMLIMLTNETSHTQPISARTIWTMPNNTYMCSFLQLVSNAEMPLLKNSDYSVYNGRWIRFVNRKEIALKKRKSSTKWMMCEHMYDTKCNTITGINLKSWIAWRMQRIVKAKNVKESEPKLWRINMMEIDWWYMVINHFSHSIQSFSCANRSHSITEYRFRPKLLV